MPVVGMVGGGQLARMTHQAAISLGLSLSVLADTPEESAARVAAAVTIGDYRSLPDLTAFAATCDVVTFDHEHVPSEHLQALADAAVVVHPKPAALRYAQDKRAMRERLDELGLPQPAWCAVSTYAGVAAFAAEHGWPVVLKAVRGGYDGRGVWVVAGPAEAVKVLAEVGRECLVEEFVPLRRELAGLVVRRPSGPVRAWPLVETVQRDGICVETAAPAQDPPEDALELATRLSAELDVTGVMAVEMFQRTDGALLINELAMRPHNSGHWTIEGARTSQFEQHLRAVLDWPLGDTAATAPAVVTVNLLGGADPDLAGRLPATLADDAGLHVHLYGKDARPGRKLGHVTALGADPTDTARRARAGAARLRGEPL